ncbi:MAG: terminase large subunit [Clostridia bacterium]|nr:terminase large subunit [Clostridia bacterium]
MAKTAAGAAVQSPPKNYIAEYYAEIKAGRVRVGKHIKAIYKILVDNIDAGVYNYDPKKATKAIRFIENFCHHSEGRSDLLKLELWQKAAVAAIFGIIDPATGYRQFREVFLLVARKNGKTLFAAAIMAYMAYIDGEYGAKLYCLAPKLDQADLCFDAFYQIVQAEKELDDITKKRRADIYIKDFNTTIKKIAFNSKKSDGFNPHFVLNDEMEAWNGDQGLKQYEVMTSAIGSRRQPVILSTSTAGYINDGIFDELMRRSTAFLKGRSDEKRLLPLLYIIDNPDLWDTREELEKSNPNLDVSVSWEFYQEQIAIARASLSKKSEFLTKYCNIKQNSSVAWLEYSDVEKAVGKDEHGDPVSLSLEDFRGCYCVGGIDLSRTTDLTAAVVIIERDDINYIFAKFFMPLERYKVAINEENTPYNIFEERGFLQLSGENAVDYRDVYNWFFELVKVYKIRPLKVGYDRYSAQYLVQDMKESGFHMDDVYQGTNLTPVLHAFEGELKDGKYCIGDNALLQSHLLNVAVDINLNDSRMKPVKIEKRAHIDGAVAIFDALAVKMKYHDEIGRQLKNIRKPDK